MLVRSHKGRTKFRLDFGDGRFGTIELDGGKTTVLLDLPKSVLIRRTDDLGEETIQGDDRYASALAGTVWEGGLR
jgi:hypothetical protein